MRTPKWLERMDPKSRIIAATAVGLVVIAVGIGFQFDNPDGVGWTGSLLQSVLYSVGRALHLTGAATEGPKAWNVPSYDAVNDFVASIASDPAAAELERALMADPFVIARWNEFQQSHDTAAFIGSLQSHEEFQRNLANMMSDPDLEGVRRKVFSQAVGQALASRFPALSPMGRNFMAETGGPKAGARGDARIGNRGDYAAGAGSAGDAQNVSGVVDPGSGELAPPGSVQTASNEDASAPSGVNIKVPSPGAGVSVDQQVCGSLNVACPAGQAVVCGSDRQWTCVSKRTCDPSGTAPSCTTFSSTTGGTAQWDSIACAWTCSGTGGHWCGCGASGYWLVPGQACPASCLTTQ